MCVCVCYLDAVVRRRGRGGRVLVPPGGRGAQLDAANTLSELQRTHRLAHVAGQRRHLTTRRRDGLQTGSVTQTPAAGLNAASPLSKLSQVVICHFQVRNAPESLNDVNTCHKEALQV